MIYHKGWTTHIPMLLKAVQMTKGSVLELGSGPFSTPLLHWLCAGSNRRLITYEADKNYFKDSSGFRSRNHSIRFVEDWDEIDFGTGHWDVAIIDNERWRRKIEPIRLKDKVDYMVIHDTNRSDYGYDKIWPHFKYIYHWKFCKPWTSVVSNFKDLSAFK